jgi:hypothetical protein
MIVGVYEHLVTEGRICSTALALDSDGTVWGIHSVETGEGLDTPQYSGVLVIPTMERGRRLGAADGADGFLGKLLLSYMEAPKVRNGVHPPQLRFVPIPRKSDGPSGTFVIELRSGILRERLQKILPALLSGLTDPGRTLGDSLTEFARALRLRYGRTEIPEIRGPEQL